MRIIITEQDTGFIVQKFNDYEGADSVTKAVSTQKEAINAVLSFLGEPAREKVRQLKRDIRAHTEILKDYKKQLKELP